MIPASMTAAFAVPTDNTVYSFTIPSYEKIIYYVVNPTGTSPEDSSEYAHAHITAGSSSVDAVQIGTTNVYYYIAGVTSASKDSQPNLGTFYGSSKMTWLEYWQNEGLTPSTLTDASSNAVDGESGGHAGSMAAGGYKDLGGFDAVARPTITYGISHFSYQYIQIFNGIKGSVIGEGENEEFVPDDPLVENHAYFAQRTLAIGGEGPGTTLVGEVNSWKAAGRTVDETDPIQRMYTTTLTEDDTFYMENYLVQGFQRIPVAVDGETYLEQMVLNEAESNAAKPAFKNFTLGGTDGAGNAVSAATGGLKTLSADGTYSKQTAGVMASGTALRAVSASVTINGSQWGDYADVYVTVGRVGEDTSLPQGERPDYTQKFLGAKYEYYGEVITDASGNPIAKDAVTPASVAGKTPLAAYGTVAGADHWTAPSNKGHQIELGFNFDSLRLGGDGTNTKVGNIYNKGSAEGKTGWYKCTLYAAGYNDVEAMVYIPKQAAAPALSLSADGNKLYLVGIEQALRAELEAGTATVKLQSGGGRGGAVVEHADFTGSALASDGSYDISDLALDPDISYSLSIATESFAPLTPALPAPTSGASITLDRGALEIGVGAPTATTLIAAVAPTADVTWAAGDNSIASVTPLGLVTGVAPGTTTIYATANGVTTTCALTVLPTGTGALSRNGGESRLETAAIASAAAFPDPDEVDAVIVAYAYDYPDALAASTLAGCIDGPILLSETGDISAVTLDEISRLSPSTIYIVGETGVMSAKAKTTLEGLSFQPTVVRLGGADRYETARLIVDESVRLGARTDEMYLVTGENFADALAVSSFAVSQKIPILLTATASLSAQTAAYLTGTNPANIFIIGGPGAISDSVLNEVKGKVPSATTTRLFGDDRYDTAEAVVGAMISRYELRPTVLGIATGNDFADALSGGAALGTRGGVLLITDGPDNLLSSASEAINLCRQYNPAVEILGREGAISITAENAIRAHLAAQG
jgi:putative cell wall-binding protein